MILTLRRIFWALVPPPYNQPERDLALMRRAGVVLDHFHNGTRPTIKGVRLASKILQTHSLPTHALRSMVRERDADLRAQSEQAQAEIAAQKTTA